MIHAPPLGESTLTCRAFLLLLQCTALCGILGGKLSIFVGNLAFHLSHHTALDRHGTVTFPQISCLKDVCHSGSAAFHCYNKKSQTNTALAQLDTDERHTPALTNTSGSCNDAEPYCNSEMHVSLTVVTVSVAHIVRAQHCTFRIEVV